VVLAFDEIHSRDFIYRDLKPENCVLDNNGYIKLTDFGFAKKRDTSKTLCGTRDYLAPEIIKKWQQSFAVDWWALGILTYEMLFGHPPFVDDERRPAEYKILDDPVQYPRGNPVTGECQDFINKLLEKNSYRRLGCRGARDVKQHAWFQKDKDFNLDSVSKGEFKAPYVRTLGHDSDLKYFSDHDEDNYEVKYRLLRHDEGSEVYDWAREF